MTQAELPIREQVLEDPTAIDVLLDSRQRAAFLPFVGRGTTVKRAALESGESPNTTLSRVRRWERMGLLQRVQVERHSRGTSLVYRSNADAYWIPYRVTPAETLVELVRTVHLPSAERVLRNYAQVGTRMAMDWGLLFQRGKAGWSIAPTQASDCLCSPLAADVPAVLLEAELLQLDPAHAKAMQRELFEVLEKYRQLRDEQGGAYNILIGLAPNSS